MSEHAQGSLQFVDGEWVSFPGGELEGIRPKTLCPACREALRRAGGSATDAASLRRRRTLCFECYRVQLDREHALKAAGRLDTASDARFQSLLPFEPVNRPKLEMLKAERSAMRTARRGVVDMSVDRRRQAQMAARHALQSIAAGLRSRALVARERDVAFAAAIHAAELQLPESWLPFVVSL